MTQVYTFNVELIEKTTTAIQEFVDGDSKDLPLRLMLRVLPNHYGLLCESLEKAELTHEESAQIVAEDTVTQGEKETDTSESKLLRLHHICLDRLQNLEDSISTAESLHVSILLMASECMHTGLHLGKLSICNLDSVKSCIDVLKRLVENCLIPSIAVEGPNKLIQESVKE
jgi:hypothetical protein